jgi:hypothetical protein
MGTGVPLGKKKAYQGLTSKLLRPCSCADARFGRIGRRRFEKIAMAFTVLLSICGIASAVSEQK